jgi:hypothetical protein
VDTLDSPCPHLPMTCLRVSERPNAGATSEAPRVSGLTKYAPRRAGRKRSKPSCVRRVVSCDGFHSVRRLSLGSPPVGPTDPAHPGLPLWSLVEEEGPSSYSVLSQPMPSREVRAAGAHCLCGW